MEIVTYTLLLRIISQKNITQNKKKTCDYLHSTPKKKYIKQNVYDSSGSITIRLR